MLTLMLTVALASPPSYMYRDHRTAKDLGSVFAINIALGCVVGGVGSRFNGGTFGRGCLVGAIGGTMVFDGKLMLASAPNIHGMGAVGKLVVDTGTSVVANAASNREMLERVVYTFGPVAVDVRSWNYGFSMLSLGGMLYYSTQGTMDWRESLYSLTPVYDVPSTMMSNHVPVSGSTVGNVIAYDAGSRITLSHELIHTAQWSEWRFANDLYEYKSLSVGQDLAFLVSSAYVLFKQQRMYYYAPQEREAYYLEQH
jgi:hypothetical protein